VKSVAMAMAVAVAVAVAGTILFDYLARRNQ
jgi:hypothetical protein